ncbi:hypothetical protein MEN41_21370, partial [Dolichospermum sp. ST_con]|nr:hypothetical protein [Dolichospermum sp. ST_con]
RRFSSSQSAPFENWELTLATDTDDFIFPDKLRNRNQTLQLWTSIHISGRGCLTVRFIRFVDIEEGNIDALVY